MVGRPVGCSVGVVVGAAAEHIQDHQDKAEGLTPLSAVGRIPDTSLEDSLRGHSPLGAVVGVSVGL